MDTTSTLTIRHQLVMHHNLGLSDPGVIAYSTVEDDGMRQRTIYLHRETVSDMGNPVVITVSVEPRDTLNA